MYDWLFKCGKYSPIYTIIRLTTKLHFHSANQWVMRYNIYNLVFKKLWTTFCEKMFFIASVLCSFDIKQEKSLCPQTITFILFINLYLQKFNLKIVTHLGTSGLFQCPNRNGLQIWSFLNLVYSTVIILFKKLKYLWKYIEKWNKAETI